MESERETMEFSQKLVQLRRREGLSQEQLADRLGVTRQSVSKWEGGAAMPDVGKLISLSDLFGVSVDYLVKDYLEEPAREPEMDETQARRLEEKVDDLTRYVRGTVYAYDSRARILGIPLVSVRIGFSRHQRLSREHVARGIIAIGNAAVGVVAIGLISVGLISLGFLAVGMLALGAVAFGAAACGVAAMGIFALGVSAVGVYAGGVAAMGSEVAVGVAATGKIAVGQEASGTHVLLWGSGLTAGEVEAFLRTHCPDLWGPLLRILTVLGAHIR